MTDLTSFDFPRRLGVSKFEWAPLFFHPIPNSPERLVVGVVVRNSDGASLVEAGGLQRLRCLYEERASEVLQAVRWTLDAVHHDVKDRGAAVLSEFASPMSGAILGAIEVAEGRDFKEVGITSLAAISSLHKQDRAEWQLVGSDAGYAAAAARRVSRAVMTAEIMDYVGRKNRDLLSNFTVRAERQRLQRINPHMPILDYSGRRVAANFGVLDTNHSSTLNAVKRRMWDLTLDRIKEDQKNKTHRQHEMLVQAPTAPTALVSDLVISRINNALRDLEKEADLNEIRLRALGSPEEIGEHLLAVEKAA
jgi:hypothetical protein